MLRLSAASIVWLALLVPNAGSQDDAVSGPIGPQVVSSRVIVPKRVMKLNTRFTPWAKPTPAQVRFIVHLEAKKWGASESRLNFRINCESTHRWNAANGQYHGLGQFAYSTYIRGLNSIGSRRVEFARKRIRIKYSYKRDSYSDGSIEETRIRPVRQLVSHRFYGVIPRNAEWTHGWAQVRIIARSMMGLGGVANSEWDAKCQ